MGRLCAAQADHDHTKPLWITHFWRLQNMTMSLTDILNPQTPPPVVGARTVYPHGAPETIPQAQAIVTAANRVAVKQLRDE